MTKEAKTQFKPDDPQHGSVINDKEKPKSVNDEIGGGPAADWILGISWFIVSTLVLIFAPKILHVSKNWASALWVGYLLISVFVLRVITESRKKRKRH